MEPLKNYINYFSNHNNIVISKHMIPHIYCFLPNHDGPEIMRVVLSISNVKSILNYLSTQAKGTQTWLTFLFMSLTISSQCQYPLENFPSSRLKECKASLQKDLVNSLFLSNLISSIFKYSLVTRIFSSLNQSLSWKKPAIF